MERQKNIYLILAKNTHLETERLLLRPVNLADAKDMYEYASDEETVRFVFPLNTSLEMTSENIATFFMKEPLGKYGIVLKENNKFIGTIDLQGIHEKNRSAEIGYAINKKYWGQGYTAEAGKKLLWLAFEKLDFIRITSRHDVLNPNSGKVLKKIGMKHEGTLLNARICKGKITNDIQYGIVKEEYFLNRGLTNGTDHGT